MPFVQLKNTKPTGLVVESTNNLDSFHRLVSNRPLLNNHVAAIENSMKTKVLYSPIYTNEALAILDGEHRVAALKRRKNKASVDAAVHVDFIVMKGLGYGSDEVPLYNTNTTNWNAADYVKHFIHLNNIEVIRAKSFLDFVDKRLPASLAIFILTGDVTLKRFRTGEIMVSEEMVDKAKLVFNGLLDFEAKNVRVWKNSKFVKAFCNMWNSPYYDHAHMQKQFKKRKASTYFTPQPKQVDYEEQLALYYHNMKA